MMRALRVDKLTLAALGATLQLHLDQTWVAKKLPVFVMATTPVDDLRRRGARLIEALGEPDDLSVSLEPSEAYLGGGSLPTEALPSCALVLRSAIGEQELLARLRRSGVVGRANAGAVWLDLRTVLAEQDDLLLAAMRSAVG